jgi:hypothetical protein
MAEQQSGETESERQMRWRIRVYVLREQTPTACGWRNWIWALELATCRVRSIYFPLAHKPREHQNVHEREVNASVKRLRCKFMVLKERECGECKDESSNFRWLSRLDLSCEWRRCRACQTAGGSTPALSAPQLQLKNLALLLSGHCGACLNGGFAHSAGVGSLAAAYLNCGRHSLTGCQTTRRLFFNLPGAPWGGITSPWFCRRFFTNDLLPNNCVLIESACVYPTSIHE